MKNQTVDSSDSSATPFPWSSSRRFWISLVLAFHLFCVTLAPVAVVEPRPGVAVETQQVLRPYSESLYLLHGYRFFAPEPGPSHSVHYDVTTASGENVSGHFPDRNKTWPRLLYHRWFMLSETVFQHLSETLDHKQLSEWQTRIQEQIASLRESDPRAARAMESQLQRELAQHERISRMRDRLVVSIGKHLLRRHDGTAVELKLVTRVIPPPEDIAMGLKLDNQRYLPPELTWSLGTVFQDSDQLESIAPLEEQGEATKDE